MAILLAIGLGIVPAAIWLFFFEQEDRKHPEAIKNTLQVFVLGAVMTGFALMFQILVNNYLFSQGIVSRSPIAVTTFAVIEELLKFFAVFYFVRFHKYFDEPLDAMIYMITVALGFAAVENIASLINQADILQAGITPKAFEVLVIRFLGANLLHCLASAILGFHWAVGLLTKKLIHWHIFAGIFIASLLHAVFNYLIIRTGPAIYAIPFVIAIAFFVLIDFEELKFKEEKNGY